jgi:transcriptional regulator with XRE-family HTH domain
MVVFYYQSRILGAVIIDRDPLNSAVAAELTGYLKAARMTQAQAAEAAHMAEQVLQRYLAGTRDIRVGHIARLAAVLNIEPAELMERASKRLAKC